MKKFLILFLAFLFSINAYSAEVTKSPSTNWYDNFLFQDKSFIFEFIRTAGYAYSGGADLGESIATAKSIKDGDINSWYQQWLKTGDRIYNLAQKMQTHHHITSAREAYLRASNYYRTAGFYMDAVHNRDKSINVYKKSKESFLKSIADLTLVTPIKIPYEGTTLPGYSIHSSLENAPVLIIQTGFDGTAEELYLEAGLAAARRGYNVILFEGPGQGSVLRQQHLPFRYDWEKVVTPVVDYVMTLENVDKNKIALMGISMGGYFAPRAAAFDKRIKALIANPGLYDFAENTYRHLPPALVELLKTNPEEFNKQITSLTQKDSTASWFFDHALWVFNVKTPAEVMQHIAPYTLKDVASKIQCPTLIVASDEDDFDKNSYQAKKLFAAIKAPKTLLKFTPEETAQAHCQMGAIAISNEKILDWLDDTFKFHLETSSR